MWSRSDDAALALRRHVIALATLVSIGLLFLVYALGSAAFAQDGGGSGNLNIEANNCSQIQLIFINQYLNNDDDDGEESVEENDMSEEEVEDAAAEISQEVGDVSQNQVLFCLTALDDGETTSSTTGTTTATDGTTTGTTTG